MGACCGNLLRDTWGRFSDRCVRFMPCLSDPARRSTLCLKIVLLTLHVVYAGVLFGLDSELIENARQVPWYIAIYYLLFIVTLVQYFVTSVSPPGYILDVMRTVNEAGALHNSTSVASKQPASSKNGSAVITIDRSHLLGPSATPWAKLVMDLYPHGSSVRTWTCTYCQSLQPPRTKHCHDCDKCVLEFDHHCVWLGTCIGQGNHCRFWWYICEETALSIWTGILYIQFLKSSISKACYLILTNQTTYELVRRRRIPYLRGVPERVFPFSKGACRNLYYSCCDRSNIYRMEHTPTHQEIEEKSKPYTCSDVMRCRCCC
ncbi:PREDICTED: protein S-acyltransferase 10-like isoform X3 [Ipomoea nil]|uniref:protein S-acyltransferase 10-like isoform X3 n=1 Tax=Ipomoea nil TaxID=35883 RepID=UPI000900A113|nr:PREDICTED: protein S-acyltransferase 10-like isoform X3 [Ipomoea nil]